MPFRKSDRFNTTIITLITVLIAVTICVVVLVGWSTENDLLTRFQSEWASMKVNTALAILFSCISVLLVNSEKNKKISLVFASLVFLIGAITLFEYFFQKDLFVDQLFVIDQTAIGKQSPGRMSPGSAISFILIGISLITYFAKAKLIYNFSRFSNAIAFVIAFVAFTGYSLEAEALYEFSGYVSIAVPTALCILLVSTGIAFSKPETGIFSVFNKNTFASRAGWKGIVLIVTILLVMTWLLRQGQLEGFYDAGFSLSMLIIGFVTALFIAIWWGTKKLNEYEQEKDSVYKLVAQSEAFNKGVLSSLISNVAVIDEQGKVVTTNKAWDDFARENGTTILKRVSAGSNLFKVCKADADDGDIVAMQVLKGMQSVLKNEIELFEFEYACPTSSKLYWFLVKVMKFIGDKPMIVVSHNNITESILAKLKLEESELKYRNMMERNLAGIYQTSLDGKILTCNTAFAAMLGYDSNLELLQKNASLIYFSDEDRTDFLNLIKKEKEINNSELKLKHKDGSPVYVVENCSLIIDKFTGKEIIEGVLVDISDRKRAETKLEESYKSIRLLTEHLQTVREDERTHIAREIHDVLGQQLTAAIMDVAWIDKKIDPKDQILKNRIKELFEVLNSMINSARKISTELRPSVLDDMGLAAAVELHLEEFEKRSGIQTKLSKPEKPMNLTSNLRIALYRIFQESLTNVARHSKAKKVEVNLEIIDEEIFLEIKDNGIGFDEKKVSAKKTLGVLGMKERAINIGGEYIISGKPGEGTLISVKVPAEYLKKTN